MEAKMKKLFSAVFLAAALTISTSALAVDSRTFVDKSDSSVSSSTAETLMAANINRRFLFIQNIGTTSVWLSYGGTAAVDTAGSFELLPGQSLTHEGDTSPRNAISILSETSAGKVTAYEG